MRNRILFRRHPLGVMLSPLDSIPDFEAYNAACAGAEFNWDEKAWFLPDVEKALRIQERLTAAGFEVVSSIELHRALMREVDVIRLTLNEAVERLERFEAVARRAGRSLFPFQRSDILWMSSRRFAINANEMGLGKTIETLATMPDNAQAIVVCPSIAKGVWAREAARWRPDLRVSVLSGRGSFHYPSPGEIVVLNYDILLDPKDLEPAPVRSDLFLVGDEAHFLKNKKSRRHKTFGALLKYATRCHLLTGTPLPNRPEELWALLDLINVAREAYGSKKNFVRCFDGTEIWSRCGRCNTCDLLIAEGETRPPCEHRQWRGYEWGLPTGESGERLKRVLVRHKRTDVLPELPGKTRSIIPIDIEGNKKALDGMLDRVPNLLSIQSMEDLPFEELSRSREALCRLKLKALEEIAESHEEAGDPIVVFSAHRHVIDELAKRPGWAAIVGGVKDRNKIEDDFQAGKLRGIAATIQAASTAITLTRASNIYFADLSYVPADNEQAEARVCRIGQTRGVIVTYLVLDHPIDRHVFDLIAKKQGIIEGSIELARGDKLENGEEVSAMVPTLAPRNIVVPAGSRGPRSDEERGYLQVFAEVCGYVAKRLSIDEKILRRIPISDKRTMERTLANMEIYEALTEVQWTLAKSVAMRLHRLLVSSGAVSAPAAPGGSHGRL